jgi:hypothetical protein
VCARMAVTRSRKSPPLEREDIERLAESYVDEGIASSVQAARVMAQNPLNWTDEE